MRRVVDGLLYDTETAEVIYTDENSKRVLYRTQKGVFFMFYQNGEIIPKSVKNAKSYLGKRDIPKYIELFGEPQEA